MKRRLLFSYLSITFFVLLVLEIPLGVAYANSVEGRLTSNLQRDAFAMALKSQHALGSATASPASRAELRGIAADYERSSGGRVVIVDRDGNVYAASRASARRDEVTPQSVATEVDVAAALGGEVASGTRVLQPGGSVAGLRSAPIFCCALAPGLLASPPI